MKLNEKKIYSYPRSVFYSVDVAEVLCASVISPEAATEEISALTDFDALW